MKRLFVLILLNFFGSSFASTWVELHSNYKELHNYVDLSSKVKRGDIVDVWTKNTSDGNSNFELDHFNIYCKTEKYTSIYLSFKENNLIDIRKRTDLYDIPKEDYTITRQLFNFFC